MSKKLIKLEVSTGDVMFAELLEDVAPKTAEAIWNMLPLKTNLCHAKFSGHVLFFFSNLDLREAECSRVCGVVPGDILYNPHVQDAAEHPNEVVLVYGTAELRNVAGHAISNLFARLLPEYVPVLQKIADTVSRDGWQEIEITKAE